MVAQSASAVVRVQVVFCRVALPTSLEAHYNVYHNLETAEARMLMPFKVRQFPVLEDDVATASETAENELLPVCVGVDKVCRLAVVAVYGMLVSC
jgi:hypothetical protein